MRAKHNRPLLSFSISMQLFCVNYSIRKIYSEINKERKHEAQEDEVEKEPNCTNLWKFSHRDLQFQFVENNNNKTEQDSNNDKLKVYVSET